jgi:UDP-N-acetylmuramoylalanine-D-glutamate ligase
MKTLFDTQSLSGKKALLLGFGKNHEALAPWLISHGVDLTIWDEKELAISRAKEVLPNVVAEVAVVSQKPIEGFDMVFRSPGIPLRSENIQAAIAKGVQVTLTLSRPNYWYYRNKGEGDYFNPALISLV